MDTVSSSREAASPVTSISFCPASHVAEAFGTDAGLKVELGEDPSLALLRAAAWQQSELCSELLHSSLSKDSSAMRDVIPRGNGFVHTVIEAYNRHRALIIRPDDVWIAILTQFCFFVNGNAEALRSTFVAHQGKKELVVKAIGNRYNMDPAYMARQMTELMQEHIIDTSLKEWIMPNFATTTLTDRSISAIVMMGTMKEYFSYKFCTKCGIPRVTLEGQKSDWEEILCRLEGLKKYGVETNTWYHLLRPIISRFVAAYDNPNTPENLDFWGKVAHETGGGSGPTWLSGWITAFCVFNERGQWQGNNLAEEQHEDIEEASNHWQLGTEEFPIFQTESTPHLTLDGSPYPRIDTNDIPCGYTYVDVKLDDNGELFDTMFVAGLVGSQICSTEQTKLRSNGARNTVRPLPAWWHFVKKDIPKAAYDEHTTQASTPPSERTIEAIRERRSSNPAPEMTNEATRNRHSFHQNITLRVRGVWDALRRK